LKILFFIESLRAGGKERRLAELLRTLRKDEEYNIELVLTQHSIHYNEVTSLGIKIHIIPRKWLKKDPLLFLRFFWIAKKFNPVIIHVWGHMPAVYAIPAKIILGIPLINNEIADSAPAKFLLAKNTVFRFSDVIISNTKAGLTAYTAPAEKSLVIYNGFHLDRRQNLENPDTIKKKLKISTPMAAAMVASFHDYKDYPTFIKAAIHILEKRSDITFLCIGDRDSTKIKNMVPERFRDRILFTGKIHPVESVMNICAMGVLMTDTRLHGEGISNALLEFMALSKPVIATDFGGSRELIKNGHSGYLIPAFDDTALAEKIELIADTPELAEYLGENGKKTVESGFTMEKMNAGFREVYQRFEKDCKKAFI
jgi:glycosyltransferase involved in cell wall biosynthesis